MENNREMDSSSSFTSDLFGSKQSPPSVSSGIFASIFPPPATVLGRGSLGSGEIGSWQRQLSGNQERNTKQGNPALHSEGASYNIANKDKSCFYQEDRANPCHLSSSLYYGGRDVYSNSPNSKTSGSNPMFKKDEGEDDPNGNNSNGASRGNWWQGSLYY